MTEKKTDPELFEHFKVIVDPGQQPIRIDRFLMDKMLKASRNRIQNGLKAGAIQVNEKEVKSNYKVRPGDVITLVLPREPSEKSPVIPQDIPLDIIYEDSDILVVNKEAGMVVHPGIGNRSGTLVNALAHHLTGQKMPVMEGNLADRPGLVHRIDKDTSGLLVIAKNEQSMTHLAKQFFDHSIKRTYYALVWGNLKEDKGTIEGNIGRHPRYRLQMKVFPDGEEGKEAITHYEVLEDLYYVSLVKCQLETGRTHQIRAHFKYIGHPLFNDERYGGDSIIKGTVFTKYKQFVHNCFNLMPRQALHAKSLGFIHPRTKEEMYFESPLPSEFEQLLQKWKHYLMHRKDQTV